MNKKIDILFYHQRSMPYLGVIAIDTTLRQQGYQTDVLVESLESDPFARIRELNPKLIGISVFSVEHNWMVGAINRIHAQFPDIPVVVGGIHAVLYPEEILSESKATLLCHSDGEAVVPAILNELAKSENDWSKIPGIAFRTADGSIHSNERAPLHEYDENIIESRETYYNRYELLKNVDTPVFLSSRGCPYSCSFCYNDHIRKTFIGKGSYMRRKSIGNFIEEIRRDVAAHRIKTVVMSDDLFTFDKKWLEGFLAEYRSKIGLPFTCSTSANIFDEDIARLLSQSGCTNVAYGIETGDETARRTILNKQISNEQIIRCGNLLHAYNIPSFTFNMYCLPDETLARALKTVEINIEARTRLAFSSLFLPFPGTKLADYCIEKGLIPQNFSLRDLPQSYFFFSRLDIPDKHRIMNVHYLTYWFVRYPVLYKLFSGLVRSGWLNPLFYVFFLLGLFMRIKTQANLSWLAMIGLAWDKKRFARENRNTDHEKK